MKRYLFIILLVSINLFFAFNSYSQDNNNYKSVSQFATETVGYIEGFANSIGGNDFSYHSLRNDVTDALLTRCTDGAMAIEWQTAPVSTDFKEKGAGFVWIAAMDHTSEKHTFDVLINGEKKFQLTTGQQKNFELTNNEGGKLRFITVDLDQYGDMHGYMALWAPALWLKSGKPLTIKLVGKAENSSAWVIIYKAKDALNYLQQSVKYNSWANIDIHKEKSTTLINISLPSGNQDKKNILTIGKKEYNLIVNCSNNECKASVTLNYNIEDNTLISLRDNFGEILSINSITKTGKSTKLANKALIENNIAINNNNVTINSVRTFKPNTVSSLTKFANTNLSKGKIYLMNSSHQDIAWMDSPEKCVIERDTMLLTPLIKRAVIDSTYRFDVEDALMLKEYIQRHPESKNTIKELLKSGKISCGSSFTQPYEEMHSGEALVRQFYLGTRWIKKEFDYTANTYWNQDVPGKTLQMAQILKKSGTDYMTISRMEKGIYNWFSPDGSSVTTYSPGHYGNDFTPLQKNFYDAAEYIANTTNEWSKYYLKNTNTSVTPLFSDWDMSPAKDYSKLINQWKNIDELQAENGKYQSIHLPEIKLSLTPEFIRDFKKNSSNIPVIKGERPAVWLYIHGPTHQKAIKASREADILLTAAEKFAAANALIDNSYNKYPEQLLNDAWEAKLYPDHGWGGKHGDITDALFQEKYYFARATAENILTSAQNEIASKIKTKLEKGLPLVVFNSLSWLRNDIVKATVTFDKSFAKNINIKDTDGNIIASQLESIEYFEDRSIKKADIYFIGTIPSIGYKTYYINPTETPVFRSTSIDNKRFDNQFYKLQLTDGGIASLFDKQLNKELIETSKFKGAEIFTMHSEGTGAGEFADIQKTDMQGFDKASNYPSDWKVSANGTIFTEFINRQPIKNAIIEQKVKIYNSLKKIDIDVAILNYEGVLYREYRMAIPLNMKDGQVSYEVPYGVLNVGQDEMKDAAGERYKTPCKDIHPRGIGNWIGASNADFGLTMSSSVAVADYIDPTENPIVNQVLQPILFASRRSCHGEGNEYLQTGDLHFSFTLTSHKPGWENGYHTGMEANEKLRSVWMPKPYVTASLPEELSFFSTNIDSVIISTVKKAEDDNNTVIRVYNISGKETEVKLKSFNKFTKAFKTNLIEEPINTIIIEDNCIHQTIGKYSIETFNVK